MGKKLSFWLGSGLAWLGLPMSRSTSAARAGRQTRSRNDRASVRRRSLIGHLPLRNGHRPPSATETMWHHRITDKYYTIDFVTSHQESMPLWAPRRRPPSTSPTMVLSSERTRMKIWIERRRVNPPANHLPSESGSSIRMGARLDATTRAKVDELAKRFHQPRAAVVCYIMQWGLRRSAIDTLVGRESEGPVRHLYLYVDTALHARVEKAA